MRRRERELEMGRREAKMKELEVEDGLEPIE